MGQFHLRVHIFQSETILAEFMLKENVNLRLEFVVFMLRLQFPLANCFEFFNQCYTIHGLSFIFAIIPFDYSCVMPHQLVNQNHFQLIK